jgi:hypothetical protein
MARVAPEKALPRRNVRRGRGESNMRDIHQPEMAGR